MNFLDVGEFVRLRGNEGKRGNGRASYRARTLPTPSFPLHTLVLIQGEPYEFIFGKERYRESKSNLPWTVWERACDVNAADPLDGYIAAWFPSDRKYEKTRYIEEWKWKGSTEVFSVTGSGCFLQELFLHMGNKEDAYQEILGVRPQMIMVNPMVMQYKDIMFRCLEYLDGRFLLGHGRGNNRLGKYDEIIEIVVRNGKLENAQNVTQLVKAVKQWILSNPFCTPQQISQKFPSAGGERSYWYS